VVNQVTGKQKQRTAQMINILYFARYRELLQQDKEQLSLSDIPCADGNSTNVADLLKLLQTRGALWSELLGDKNCLVAVNQAMRPLDHEIVDGDEVAFFPPVTGG